MLRPQTWLIRPVLHQIWPQISPIVSRLPSIHLQTRGLSIFMPRRVRSNKTQKGRIPCRTGHSTKGTTLQYGDYGLRLTHEGRSLSAKQLQTADNILRKALKDVKGHRIYYRFACGKAVCKKGNEVRMGKGKGTFDHWGLLAPAGKVLFELKAPDVKLHIVKEAFDAAGMAIPGPVQFINRAKMDMVQPAYCGRGPSPVYHAGIKVDGSIDTKVRAEAAPSVVISPQIGYEKLQKHNAKKITVRKGLVRR